MEPGFSGAALPSARITSSGLSSSNVVAAVSAPVSPDARDGLVVLNADSVSPDITVPSTGNTFYVNVFTDNTTSIDAPDSSRCSNGSSETCTLRDAVTYASDDATENINAGTSDTIMLPAGTYSLSYQNGKYDTNGNYLTHLEILGPVTIIGSTSGGGVIINGNNYDTIFTINPGPFGSYPSNPNASGNVFKAALENLTIENGKNQNDPAKDSAGLGLTNDVGGCINWDALGTGNLTITNSVIENCSIVNGDGGGVWAINSIGGGTGTLTLSGDTIANNTTPLNGGGLAIDFPAAAVSGTNTVFSGNKADVRYADVNGDSIPDLVVANYTDGTVSVALGSASLTYTVIGPFPIGSKPYSAAAADINGTGMSSVVVANTFSNNTGVLQSGTQVSVPYTGLALPAADTFNAIYTPDASSNYGASTSPNKTP